ncbi:hypothetical protein BC628DRAFT_1429686 [Trametes gibbosa]|nr:hypothetical protein BC628DRAFT_1412316 [Trametes gibbosa]KAI0828157.1 hypothetical protein BC628DRAFT_1429686 [Trametes gibbosa]
MGNAQSLTRTSGALDSYVTELGGDVVYERRCAISRCCSSGITHKSSQSWIRTFLEDSRMPSQDGYLVVKIFIKPDPGLSLRKYHRRLKIEREALADIPNVYGYQSFVETDKAGYVIRQWVASNLYDRISTRPFLSPVEKKWIAFQILNGLRDARNRKVSHGDIKSENILVTSWNWVYVSDFASYKPTFLPLDDPSDFSFFFDTSGRRSSTTPDINAKKSRLAVEDTEGRRDGKVTEAMDCFSVGCVIAELFLEGKPLFTLSELFKYREGELKLDTQLGAIEEDGVRDLIKQMVGIDPATRPTFDTLLHTSRGAVNAPALFSNAQGPPATPISAAPSAQRPTGHVGASVSALNGDSPNDPLPSDSDHRMERIWADYESVEPYLVSDANEETVMDVKVDYTPQIMSSRPFHDILPVELNIPNRESKLHSALSTRKRAAAEDGPALIILSLICANIRNCHLPSSKVRALDVFLALSAHLTDEAKLDRMVPYIVDLLHDDAAIVRASALRTLMQVLMLVTVITPSNAAIFPEYIIPAIAHLVRDPEVMVRCMYAQIIVPLADTAVRYLEMGQALKAHGTYKLSPDTQEYDEAHFEVSYDASMNDLQNSIQEHLSALLVDPSSVVKRAVLHNISSLCIFLGRQKTNDVLLSHMITYLNDRDWLLRYAFFDSIVDVAACAGGRSLEEYILPLMIQALSDVEETVVAKVLASLTNLCELGLFHKMRIWELMSATLGFLYHPNIWIRQGAAAFIASAAKHLPPSDVWCILYPSLRHFLRSDVQDVDEKSLLLAMKHSLSRQVFDAAVQWAMKADKTSFWRSHRTAKIESPRESMATVRQSGNTASRARSEEDETQLAKLQQLGMTSVEEAKLMAMRDYILKLARAISSFASRILVEVESDALKTTGTIELQKLGVVPQTVFLRAPESEGRSPRLSAHRSSSDFNIRSPGTPRTTRTLSIDQGPTSAGAPFEDLRRRLAIINGSGSSLAIPGSREARSPLPHPLSIDTNALHAPTSPEMPQGFERPGSPAESTVSTTNSSAFRAMHRFPISGEGQKAAPAIGSSKASATGLLEAHTQIRSDSPSPSGRSSPVSVAGTVRGQDKRPSVAPISSYDGQEAGISNLLEHLYLDDNRDLQSDFGPNVHEGPIRRRNAARHASFMARDGASRRLEASLISHYNSHSDAVTGLAVSPDHMFFVSASDDKTVKVWDTARLERNVTSKPRHTYNQHHARVKSICMLEGVHCFASAAEDGSLHVVRVHVSQSGQLPKYSKLQVIREHRVETPGEYITSMVHYATDTSSNLIYATTHSVISIVDLRTMRTLQRMENPRHHGPITCICLDRKRAWVICGTSTGILSLWDIRFGILLKSWRVGLGSKGRSGRVHQCLVHPTKGKGKWVVVAIETPKNTPENPSSTILEVWDIERTALVEAVSVRATHNPTEVVEEPKEVSVDEAEMNPAAAIAALVRARQEGGSLDSAARRGGIVGNDVTRSEVPLPPSSDVRAIVAGSEFGGHTVLHRSHMAEPDSKSAARPSGRGFLITGSEDCKLRFWDLGRPDRSVVLSGLEVDNEKPSYSVTRAATGSASSYVETWTTSPSTHNNRPPQRLSLINHNQQNLLKGHQDTITAIACIDSPFRGGLVTADRAGVIKVWRVEAFDST